MTLGSNLQNPNCGTLYKTNGPGSSKIKLQERGGEREREKERERERDEGAESL